jgi:hypothetical protein
MPRAIEASASGATRCGNDRAAALPDSENQVELVAVALRKVPSQAVPAGRSNTEDYSTSFNQRRRIMKLVNAIFALALAVLSTQAFAGQQFGRDSVYASASRMTGASSRAGAADRHGRDSVYALGKAVQGTPVQSAKVNVLKAYGRA